MILLVSKIGTSKICATILFKKFRKLLDTLKVKTKYEIYQYLKYNNNQEKCISSKARIIKTMFSKYISTFDALLVFYNKVLRECL